MTLKTEENKKKPSAGYSYLLVEWGVYYWSESSARYSNVEHPTLEECRDNTPDGYRYDEQQDRYYPLKHAENCARLGYSVERAGKIIDREIRLNEEADGKVEGRPVSNMSGFKHVQGGWSVLYYTNFYEREYGTDRPTKEECYKKTPLGYRYDEATNRFYGEKFPEECAYYGLTLDEAEAEITKRVEESAERDRYYDSIQPFHKKIRRKLKKFAPKRHIVGNLLIGGLLLIVSLAAYQYGIPEISNNLNYISRYTIGPDELGGFIILAVFALLLIVLIINLLGLPRTHKETGSEWPEPDDLTSWPDPKKWYHDELTGEFYPITEHLPDGRILYDPKPYHERFMNWHRSRFSKSTKPEKLIMLRSEIGPAPRRRPSPVVNSQAPTSTATTGEDDPL